MGKKIIFLLVAINLLLTCCGGDSPTQFQQPPRSSFKIDYYDLFFEIDAGEKLFRSTQNLTITPSLSTASIIFDLHSDLTIDSLSLRENNGVEFPIVQWEVLGDVGYDRGWGTEQFTRVKIQTVDDILAGQTLKLLIVYHMNPAVIGSSPGDELLKLTISTGGSRALHPTSGILPVFGGNISAPFRIGIKYPQGQYSCVPGNLMATQAKAGYVTEIYETEFAHIPVFYIGPAEKVERSRNGLTVEYYLAPGQPFVEDIIDKTFEVAQLYTERFGNPGTTAYRFAFVDVRGSSTTGESKGNAIYFAYRGSNDFVWNEEGKTNFVQLISHELFHNWNLWYVHWTGKLYEWFGEGGASFMSAWAGEQVFGQDAGAAIRSSFVNGFIQNRGYEALRTLENAQKSSSAERSLIYSYGALVWEQLRQKLGEIALFAGLDDFFTTNEYKSAGYSELYASLQAHTEVPVEPYLDQWIKHNAKIDLSIRNVTIHQSGNLYETTVEFNIDSDRDYEIFTAIGYKTSVTGQITNIEIHTSQKGIQTLTFTSDQQPVLIQLDPDYRVPQIESNNDSWSD
ncbi:hypothetical protein GWN42_22620 [candidate division KSB1 bacterium]|nr:hypothetical protein [candidate division KSB1 bacterium]